jgi:hypothetical protein
MNTISKQTAHRLFRYGTHQQLENSIKRWLKNGIATKSDCYYAVSQGVMDDALQLEINIKDGAITYKTGAVVIQSKDGWYLLGASL